MENAGCAGRNIIGTQLVISGVILIYCILITFGGCSQEMGKDSISTQNEALVQDRQMGCRGSTPLREIGNPDIHRDYVNGRAEEYIELLRCVHVS